MGEQPGDDALASAGGLVELPSWVKRARPTAKPHSRPVTLSERLRQASGDQVIDLIAIEEAVARLRPDDEPSSTATPRTT